MSVDEMREMSQRIVRRERAQQTERARLTRKVQRGGTKHEPGATKAQPPKSKRRAKTKAGRASARRNR